MMMNKKYAYVLYFLVLLFFAGGSFARAATLGVVARNTTPEIGQPFRIDIPLYMQGDDANAIQAHIIFPSDLFSLQSVNDGASPVSFWIESPAEIASGVVAFSGIMPGGFQGSASSVVSLWFTPRKSGTGLISFGNVQLLRNDGQGTAIETATGTVTVDVSTVVATATPSHPISFIVPEIFTPVISQNPDIFGGKYFLVFSTTDKGSGIDHYEVLETPSHVWHVATSPYLLTNQSLSSDIYVRAVDHDGNFIVVKVPAEHPASGSYGMLGIVVILVLIFIALCIVFLVSVARRRRSRR